MDPVTPTLVSFVNTTALPLTIQSTTSSNWTQFIISCAILLIGSLGFLLYTSKGIGLRVLVTRINLERVTGRKTLVIKHNPSGLFDTDSMIGPKTLEQITRFLAKNQGRPVNIVLHTPGGIVFYSQQIADMISNHSAKTTCYVPVMALSGGTLLALSCSEIKLSPTSCLGQVDPQLGYFWNPISARSHKDIAKYKGRKSDDSTLGFAHEGEKCRRSIEKQLTKLLDSKCLNPKELATRLTNGSDTHGERLTYNDLVSSGLRNVRIMNEQEREITTTLV